jgi:cyclophilin family peptidyl-prolyl cis-trans isomerase
MDRQAAPNTVLNFFQYIEDDFYDNTVFHRVVNTPSPFVIQGGAFESLGQGNSPRLQERQPRDPIQSEAGNGLSNIRATIAMALRGSDANSATSQFFINLDDNSFLDDGSPPFTVFGEVTDGMTVVDAIAAVPTGSFLVTVVDDDGITSNTTFQDVPVEDVTVIDIFRE